MRLSWMALVTASILGVAAPSPAQLASKLIGKDINCINAKLQGHVVDYTHNHGADRRLPSNILGMTRDLYVYLPPGYTPARAYPVVLYLHTAFFDEHMFVSSDMLVQLDQMMAAGTFPHAIVACPDGLISGENSFNQPHSMYVNGVYGRFEDHLLHEVMPFLQANYSVRPEREAHALLGLSAGGMGAMSIGLRHREMFGTVATLAAPLNLRCWNCQEDYFADFDPATYRWRNDYDPEQIIGIFFCGLRKTRAKTYLDPVLGRDPGVLERTIQVNPADQIFRTNLRPGEMSLYINCGTEDNFNFDAQAASFAWLAAQQGVAVTHQSVPGGKHDATYFRSQHVPAYQWLAGHILPPTP